MMGWCISAGMVAMSENGLLAHSHHWSKASFIGASRNGPSLGESWGLGEGVLCAFGQF